jgi:hypothetical protein
MNANAAVYSYFNWIAVRFRIDSAHITERHFFISAPRKITDKFFTIILPLALATLWAVNAQNNGVPWLIGALLGFFFGACSVAAFTFFLHALDIIFYFCVMSLLPFFIPILLFFSQEPQSHVVYLFAFTAATLFFLALWYMVPAAFMSTLRTLTTDKDRQAHLLFVASMALLGWGLWLQNGGNLQNMAVLDSPIVLPLVNWKIPFTDSLGFLFALLGFVHDPVAGSLSVAVQAHINEIALFMGAGLLFLFAEIRLHKSAVGVQPRFALLAFVLFWLAVFVEVALHWSSAPALHPAVILFNRAFAVLAFGVYLFWRRVAKYGEPVRGADGVFKAACDWAELEGWKIAAWLLGLLWLSTQLSDVWLNGFPEPIQYILYIVLLGVPLRKIIGFKHEFDSLLAPYRNALQLERESYQPPPVVATEKETRDALGDDDDDKGR